MKYLDFVFILALTTIASVPAQQPTQCAEPACPTEINPVCGHLEHESQKIYRTFHNECKLIQTNCENPLTPYVQIGDVGQTCDDQQLKSTCSKDCPDPFFLVCGVQWGAQNSYLTFSNACGLWQANCQHPELHLQQLGKPGEDCTYSLSMPVGVRTRPRRPNAV